MIVKEIIFYGMKRNQLKRETNECLGGNNTLQFTG